MPTNMRYKSFTNFAFSGWLRARAAYSYCIDHEVNVEFINICADGCWEIPVGKSLRLFQ